MGGAHGHRRAAPPAGRTAQRLLAVVAPLGLLAVLAMVLLWPADVPAVGEQADEVLGTIVALDAEVCPDDLPDAVNACGTAEVRTSGSGGDAGRTISAPLPQGTGAPEVGVGDDVVLIRSTSPDGTAYSIVDHQRAGGLWVVAAASVLALVAFGRWKGVTALAGLGVTFAVLLLFVVPAVLAGESPVLVAIAGSAAIMVTVLYLTHGFAASTSVAVLGTFVSLGLTGVLSALAVSALHLTGVTDDLSASLGMNQQVNTQGLLLAGIVIGTLGVLDDVTVTQAVTVEELVRANPRLPAREAYRAGARVGRSHVASVVNTVILAYAGSSLPLLILITSAGGSLGSVLTDQVIAQELVRSAAATLGLIAAVPVTTALAALVATREATREATDGARSAAGPAAAD